MHRPSALVEDLGGGLVAVANLLTALLMAVYLVGAARRAFHRGPAARPRRQPSPRAR